jgi:PHS family inorganic phosphate transporter-like MFS transporter
MSGNNSDSVDLDMCKTAVDSIWRIVVGVGAIPAVVAIVFRFLIWDSGLYDLEVKKQGPRALINTARVYGGYEEVDSSHATDADHAHALNGTAGEGTHGVEEPRQFSMKDLRQFFIEEENYKYLVGTSLCWFLLDFAFYGLGMGTFSLNYN